MGGVESSDIRCGILSLEEGGEIMDVNGDFDRRHDVHMTIQFEMYGIKRVPSDKIIDALRMLDVVGNVIVGAVDMENGSEIYRHESEGIGEWI